MFNVDAVREAALPVATSLVTAAALAKLVRAAGAPGLLKADTLALSVRGDDAYSNGLRRFAYAAGGQCGTDAEQGDGRERGEPRVGRWRGRERGAGGA